MDDGADLVNELHTARRELLDEVVGGTEETTTGVIRLRAMAAAGKLAYPVVAVNEALTKHLFDNRYGTGQSAIDGILRATNVLLAGKTAVVGGYGWVGKGIASRAHGMGANVVVVEVDPIRALEAAMDGHRVMNAADAARVGDLFISATGNLNVWGRDHFAQMPDGAILANAGHFNDEFELGALEEMATSSREVRPFTREYLMPSGTADLRPRRRTTRQPRRGRGPSGAGHGHELRKPGARARVAACQRRGPRARRLRHPRGHRPRGRAAQAREHGRAHRADDAGAEGLQRVVGVRHLTDP